MPQERKGTEEKYKDERIKIISKHFKIPTEQVKCPKEKGMIRPNFKINGRGGRYATHPNVLIALYENPDSVTFELTIHKKLDYYFIDNNKEVLIEAKKEDDRFCETLSIDKHSSQVVIFEKLCLEKGYSEDKFAEINNIAIDNFVEKFGPEFIDKIINGHTPDYILNGNTIRTFNDYELYAVSCKPEGGTNYNRFKVKFRLKRGSK